MHPLPLLAPLTTAVSRASPRPTTVAASSTLVFPDSNASSLLGIAATLGWRLEVSSLRRIRPLRTQVSRLVMGVVGFCRMGGPSRIIEIFPASFFPPSLFFLSFFEDDGNGEVYEYEYY